MRVVIGYFVCLAIAVSREKMFHLTVIALPCTVLFVDRIQENVF